jgi:hypothetical protein
MMGIGWYAGVEIEAAQKHLGAKIEVLDLWVARQPPCECHTYDFIHELFQKRIDLEREAKTRGQPIKLGINALSGKLAQQVGNAPYYDIAASAIVTATVRAQLIAAYAADPEAIVYLATDGIASTRPLPLSISPKDIKFLGGWSEEPTKPDLFVMQSGMY